MICCVLWAAAAAGGCDSQPPAVDASKPGECAGATAAEAAETAYQPKLVRGRVLAPFGKMAGRSPFPDWLVGAARAAPLANERTVPEVTVRLYRVGPTGARQGPLLREATTDIKGQWCLKLPDAVDFDDPLMLAAAADDATLRRPLVSTAATDIYSGTEALTQLLERRGVDFTRLPTSTYLNMGAMADTAFDLLEPVTLADGDDIDATVGRIRAVLANDRRLTHSIAGLAKNHSDP